MDKNDLPVSVEEKLKKFQFICEEKVRKIEVMNRRYERNEETLRGFKEDYHMEKEIVLLNLKVAQTQLDSGWCVRCNNTA